MRKVFGTLSMGVWIAVGTATAWAAPPSPPPVAPYWETDGNVGTHPGWGHFLGTTDDAPLELRANRRHALSLWQVEYRRDSDGGWLDFSGMNLRGGAGNNEIWSGVTTATIGGGGGWVGIAGMTYQVKNLVTDVGGTIGGGVGNVVGNSAGALDDASFATVGGGWGNRALAKGATVGAGWTNRASGFSATVPGGYFNVAGGDFSLAAGQQAHVREPKETGDRDGDEGTFVWADAFDDLPPAEREFTSTGPNQFLIRATGGVGINRNDPTVALDVNGAGKFSSELFVGSVLTLGALDGGGFTQLCLNGINHVSSCSSSLRYKTDVQPLPAGLDVVRRLRPISFAWRGRPGRDVGLAAEQVAEVEPLLVTRNDAGEIEGVKYPQLSVVLINAIQEQQAEMVRLRQMVEEQRAQIEGMRERLDRGRPSTVAVR